MSVRRLIIAIVGLAGIVALSLGAGTYLSPNIARAAFTKVYPRLSSGHQQILAELYLIRYSADEVLSWLEAENRLCHTEAHPVGRAIFIHTGAIADSITTCGSRCSYGCFHGALMELFASESDSLGGALTGESTSDMLSEISSMAGPLCSRPDVQQFVVPWACIHGFGHVAMYMSEYDPAEAVIACETFEDHAQRSRCVGGAFMEFMQSDVSDVSKEAAQKKDLFPCDQFPKYARNCFIYKGRPMVVAWGSIEAAAEACRALPSEKEMLSCIRGLGVTGGTFERLATEHGLESICGAFSGDERASCVEGAITHVVFRMDAHSAGVCESMYEGHRPLCRELFQEFEELRL